MQQDNVKAKLLALSDLCYSVRKKTPIPFKFEINLDCKSSHPLPPERKMVNFVYIP